MDNMQVNEAAAALVAALAANNKLAEIDAEAVEKIAGEVRLAICLTA